MKKQSILFISLVLTIISCGMSHTCIRGEESNYPVIAHSHNDYEQSAPISTALKHRFRSLEVDIVYDGINIRVSHDNDNLQEKPLFEDEYFDPLLGALNKDFEAIILLIDIKQYSDELLLALKTILENHKVHLVSRNDVSDVNNKIQIVLSGNIPRTDLIQDESNEFIFIDGRFKAYDMNASSLLVPIISMDFTELVKWHERIKLTAEKKIELKNVIDLIHEKDKLVRFWKTNDNESTWLTLIDLDVDIIGVDNIEKFCRIMNKNGLTE